MTRSKDEEFMDLACRLALRALGKTSPNPMVGAVLVKDGAIIGKGYHKKPGTPHAEVIAIQSATTDPKGASLYVNLEPCCHFGRTPPCVDFILSKGIRRVIIGTLDPNPLVDGKSIEKLRDRGVEVESGLLEARCKRVNEVFLKYIQTKIPFITLKVALSLDGKIASSSLESRWISSEESRKRVHWLRSLVDAIVVGIGTVISDDPLLTVRGVRAHRNPLRVVMDSRLRIPVTAQVVQRLKGVETLIATTQHAPREKARALKGMGTEVEVFDADGEGRVPMDALVTHLGERGIQSLLIEGGSQIFTSALEKGLVDKLVLFIAPTLMGGERAPTFFEGKGFQSPADAAKVEELQVERSGCDIMIRGYLRKRRLVPEVA